VIARDVALAGVDRVEHRRAAGERGGGRGDERVSGAMGMGRGGVRRPDLGRVVAVEEKIDGVASGEIPALDEHPR
jgi:hypothetical protein